MPETKRYARLKALLQEKITSGAYQPGDRFFSQNELMRKYELSFATVTRALDELVTDGYLIRKQGKGTFITKTTPGPALQQDETKHVAIFARWQTANTNQLGHVNTAEFYRQLQTLSPDWVNLHLIPTHGTAETLEPWLFSRQKTDAAIALSPTPEEIAILHKMAEQFPIVTITHNIVANLPTVVTDYVAAASIATQHLIDTGHTTIGLIMPAEQNSASIACQQGYHQTLRAAAYPPNNELIATCGHTDPTGYHTMLQLYDINSSLGITAIVIAGSALLPGVLYAMQTMGKTLSNQFSIVCIDDQQTNTPFAAKVSRVIFPINTLVESTLTQLLAAFSSNLPQPVLVPPQLIPPATITAR